MLDRLKHALPVLAVLSGLTLAADVALLERWKSSISPASGVNRDAADAILTELQETRPASIDDRSFRRAVERLLDEPYVATVWLLAPDGRFVFGKGSTAASTPVGDTADHLATDDTRLLLSVLPPDALSDDQRTWLLAASAIRREGAHNDVYGHLLRPVPAASGSVVALVAVAYELRARGPGLAWLVGVALALACAIVYWASLPLWVYLDARNRGERAPVWATFVLVGNLVALMAYILRQTPKAEAVAP
jgi:hypothetical protein